MKVIKTALIDAFLIMIALVASIVTTPDEIVSILIKGPGVFVMAIGLLWMVGAFIRLLTFNHPLISFCIASSLIAIGFLTKCFGNGFLLATIVIALIVAIGIIFRQILISRENTTPQRTKLTLTIDGDSVELRPME